MSSISDQKERKKQGKEKKKKDGGGGWEVLIRHGRERGEKGQGNPRATRSPSCPMGKKRKEQLEIVNQRTSIARKFLIIFSASSSKKKEKEQKKERAEKNALATSPKKKKKKRKEGGRTSAIKTLISRPSSRGGKEGKEKKRGEGERRDLSRNYFSTRPFIPRGGKGRGREKKKGEEINIVLLYDISSPPLITRGERKREEIEREGGMS